jgi:hypothetical protein
MSKKYAALALAVTLTLGGVSLASASPGDSRPARETPSAPDPVKPLTRVSEAPAGGYTGDMPEGIAGGYVFVPINPYRTIDSRDYADGYLLPGEAVYFDVLVDQTNVPMIPPEAVAVTFNLTATNTSGGGGFLAVFPADINWPGNSNINWSFDGTTIANSGTVKLGHYDAPGQITVAHGPANRPGGVDFVVDITGYYI